MSAVTHNSRFVDSPQISQVPGVTGVLARLRSVDRSANDPLDPRLMDLVYEEIERLTKHSWVKPLGSRLEKSDLVNEVWLKLLAETNHSKPWASREHFFNTVALTMQQVIVDHIRRCNAQKRVSDRQRAPIDPAEIPSKSSPECILLVADALEQLQARDANAARVVRLKYFGGYTQEEIVQILDVSLATVRKHWVFGQTWIKTYINRSLAE